MEAPGQLGPRLADLVTLTMSAGAWQGHGSFQVSFSWLAGFAFNGPPPTHRCGLGPGFPGANKESREALGPQCPAEHSAGEQTLGGHCAMLLRSKSQTPGVTPWPFIARLCDTERVT